jgi:hypothetical protein
LKRLPLQGVGLVQKEELDADEPEKSGRDQDEDKQDDRLFPFHALSLQRQERKIPEFNIV